MKILATTFRKDSFDFTQVRREGRLAIYHKTKPTGAFEVVVIQTYKARTFPSHMHNGIIKPGHSIEAGEAMPSSESWGLVKLCQALSHREHLALPARQ